MTAAATGLWRAKLETGLSRLAPRPHARGLPELRAAYPGLEPDELAEQLVADAARRGAAVGAVAGCCALAPVPLGAPLAALGQSALVSALCTRLTAELHEVFGLPNPSPVNGGTTGYVAQWAAREGKNDLIARAVPAAGWTLVHVLPRAARRRLPNPRTLLASTAIAAGLRSGRQTRAFGESLRLDLRSDPTARDRWTE
ncbi:MAG TPA: hypothetical protein VL551_29895 [Actinospica sp.]|jgi:hypothetical protein|nr:hypothetical protein [Actinospica sp.]